MAEFDELDGRLRDALGQAAQPGDSAGVADAIRSRVAAGDSGTSVASSTAPGWGGGAWGWLPVLGVVIAAVVAGGAVGASGLVGRPVETVDAAAPVVVLVSVDALACVDGPVIDDIPAGTPVLATVRSEDSSWVGVRSPAGDGSVVWIPVGVLTLDEGQPELAGLPIGGACPVVVTPTPTPTPEPDPVPVPDTKAPSVQASADQQVVYWMNGTNTTITAATTDDRGVTGASISWSGFHSGSAAMSGSGSTWAYFYDSPGGNDPVPQGSQITFVVTVRDAAGNTATSTVVVQVSQ